MFEVGSDITLARYVSGMKISISLIYEFSLDAACHNSTCYETERSKEHWRKYQREVTAIAAVYHIQVSLVMSCILLNEYDSQAETPDEDRANEG
jgi:hypothetical protein